MQIILATTSPYRKEAFAFLKIPFIVKGSEVDESKLKGIHRNDPRDLVFALAKAKAEAVAKNYKKMLNKDAIVFGFDSVGIFEGKFLDKPKSREQAFDRLKRMSGNMHEFITGVYVINTKTGKTISRLVKTIIYFRDFSDEEINKYLDEDELYKTLAAAYNALNHYSATFAKRIDGSPHNLLSGLPLEIIPEILNEALRE